MKLLLTGGCGFIGAAVVRHLMRSTGHVVINADKLTHAASEDVLEDARGHNRHVLVRADVSNAWRDAPVPRHQPDAAAFNQTNVVGTFTLLEETRQYYATLSPARRWANRAWWQAVRARRYAGERLGTVA